MLQIGDAEHEEGEVEGEEEQEEGDGGFEGADEEDECEDEPALDGERVLVGLRIRGGIEQGLGGLGRDLPSSTDRGHSQVHSRLRPR